MQKLDILKQSLKQVERWRCPPHWNPHDWREEMLATAWAALYEGLSDGIQDEVALRRFVTAALMRRYRDEWNYGTRWVQKLNQYQDEDGSEGETDWELWDRAEANLDEDTEQKINFFQILVRQALAQLSKEDRYLIERKFWDMATERELAKELGISQPAVHKRLKRILERLKDLLHPF